ncbi:MAG: DUF6545 domain-containing protein [Chloroflexota bacterium]
MALFPPRSPIADLLTVRDLRFHLYRRVIEIRDGQLLLCRHLDARPAAFARQRCAATSLPESETQAVIEATEIATALHTGPSDDNPAPPRSGRVLSGARDVVGEVAALERVAYSYRRSPIVRAVVDQLDREAAPAESTERIMG